MKFTIPQKILLEMDERLQDLSRVLRLNPEAQAKWDAEFYRSGQWAEVLKDLKFELNKLAVVCGEYLMKNSEARLGGASPGKGTEVWRQFSIFSAKYPSHILKAISDFLTRKFGEDDVMGAGLKIPGSALDTHREFYSGTHVDFYNRHFYEDPRTRIRDLRERSEFLIGKINGWLA